MRTEAAIAQLEEMRRDRRALHRIPELGRDLAKTRAYLKERLAETAPDEISDVADGIKAVYLAKDPAKGAIAFRADMDALPVLEKTGLPFASTHEGQMHACGHDGHMAALLALARIVAKERGALKRDVVLLFQPAEENGGGAKGMVEAGVLNDPDVCEVYGMHLMPQVPSGYLAINEGPVMSGVSAMNITVKGKSAHGAMPHRGADPICAAAQGVISLEAALRRTVDPAEPVVFTIGKFEAGTVRNVLAEQAKLECTVRAFEEGLMTRVLDTAKAAFQGADALYGTQTDIEIPLRYPPVINTPAETAKCIALAGESRVSIPRMSISEDFSEFINARAGAFVFCGTGGEEPLHSAKFDFDEESLVTGLSLFESILREAD